MREFLACTSNPLEAAAVRKGAAFAEGGSGALIGLTDRGSEFPERGLHSNMSATFRFVSVQNLCTMAVVPSKEGQSPRRNTYQEQLALFGLPNAATRGPPGESTHLDDDEQLDRGDMR